MTPYEIIKSKVLLQALLEEGRRVPVLVELAWHRGRWWVVYEYGCVAAGPLSAYRDIRPAKGVQVQYIWPGAVQEE